MSALGPISISSLADQALTKLVQAITSGEFKPGQKLSEVHLARELGISRGPLREALGRLEGRLVKRMPRIGVSVIQLSHADLAELFLIREALEGMACRLAAQRITVPEVSDLQELLDEHSKNKRVLSRKGYFQRSPDDDIHVRIVRYAQNQRLEELLMHGVYYQLQLYRFRASSEPGRALVAFDEHCAIVLALKDRDPNAAEALMRQHIRNSFASLAKAHETREEVNAKLDRANVASPLKAVRSRA